MKKIVFASLLLIGLSIINACNTKKRESTTTTTGTENPSVNDSINANINKTVDTTSIDKNSIDFVSMAMRGGIMEVEEGNIALQKAKNQRVKDFAAMMVSDHTKANDELRNIITSKNIAVSTTMSPEQQRELDKLKNKTGNEFDKSYMKMMVDDHKRDVEEFKKAANNVTDTDIKQFVSRILPVIQKHLDSANAIHAKM